MAIIEREHLVSSINSCPILIEIKNRGLKAPARDINILQADKIHMCVHMYIDMYMCVSLYVCLSVYVCDCVVVLCAHVCVFQYG